MPSSGNPAAAVPAARETGPGSLNILGNIFSKLIVTPSIDELGLSAEGEGGLAKARENLKVREEAAAAAAAAEKDAESEAASGFGESAASEEVDDSVDMQATELGMDVTE